MGPHDEVEVVDGGRGKRLGLQLGGRPDCADWTVNYHRGVELFWLHIAYHGTLDCGRGKITWQDRVLGAMRLVVRTLLRGQDVVVHSNAGPQMATVICESKCFSQF